MLPLVRPSLPRQRLYTRLRSYQVLFRDIVLQRTEAGEDREELEGSFAGKLGTSRAVAVGQARLAIYLAVKAIVRGKKCKILMSPFTIFDVVNMVVCAGGEPEFVDIIPGSYTLNAQAIKDRIGPDVAAVIVTHTHQMCGGLLQIKALCRENDIALVEDCAVALGTEFEGQSIGTFGDVGIFSFGLFKNVCTFYGGMLVTENETLYQRIRDELKTFDRVGTAVLLRKGFRGVAIDLATHSLLFKALTFWCFRYGLLNNVEYINKWTHNDPNPHLVTKLVKESRMKMSQTQARIAAAELDRVESDIQQRLCLASFYAENLAEFSELKLPDGPFDSSSAYHVFPIQFARTEQLQRYLVKRGRDCSSYYYRNCASLDCFKPYLAHCPEAELATRNSLLLPTYPGYGLDEATRNVEAIRVFFRESSDS